MADCICLVAARMVYDVFLNTDTSLDKFSGLVRVPSNPKIA